jgi:tetratricopeptide (TPR) repeat protein
LRAFLLQNLRDETLCVYQNGFSMRWLIGIAALVWSTVAFADDTPAPPSTATAAPAASPPCTDFGTNKDAASICDRALAAAPDDKAKAELLFRRAFTRNVVGGFAAFKDGLADLDMAIKLDPGNSDAHHERAFIFNEIGRWKEAAADLDIAIKLTPDDPGGYSERALSRFNLGDLQGVLDDREMEVKLQPSATAYLARARAHLWLGQYDAAFADIAEGRKHAGNNNVAIAAADVIAAQMTFWKQTSPQGAKACDPTRHTMDYNSPFLIGDCTLTFLTATTAKDKAAALSARSLAWITGANDIASFVDDSRVASALLPEDAPLHSNLGFAYLRTARPAAALEQFNAAVAIAPTFANTAGRAQAKLELGDLDGAEADAKQSVDFEPNRIALIVLGDCAYARTKTFDKAKEYWLQAFNGGPPDDGLIRRLTAAGVPIPQTPAEAPVQAPLPDAASSPAEGATTP